MSRRLKRQTGKHYEAMQAYSFVGSMICRTAQHGTLLQLLQNFTIDENKTAEDLNRDLESVRLWAWQWKMHFSSDKTEEVIFSTKRVKPWHPPLTLGNDLVTRKAEQSTLV